MRLTTLVSVAGTSMLLCSAFLVLMAAKADPTVQATSVPPSLVPPSLVPPSFSRPLYGQGSGYGGFQPYSSGSGGRAGSSQPLVGPVTGRRMTDIPTSYLYFEYRNPASPQVTSGPPMPVPKGIFVSKNSIFRQLAASSRRNVSKHQAICASVITRGGTNSKTRPSPAGSRMRPSRKAAGTRDRAI